MSEPLSIDQIIERLQDVADQLPEIAYMKEADDALSLLHSRLSGGELQVAIIGQFNRGKSTFINRLIDIEHLPVSVLPLTAIPTEIRYGEENCLSIAFSDSEREFSEPQEIKKALREYVTEGENPENVKDVISVKLTAPSEILSHGTTIIDTPGFGSTHIHNTKATLERLKECDAAFFLLSADLPITQMELNFIKQIAPQVTRLFFIYNKTDLLTEDELDTTISFIKKTIEQQLKIATTERFFPVSAKLAEHDREASGLIAIEKEVLDFLQREKYFSLAEAIQSKLKLIRSEMITALNEALHELQENLKSATDKIHEISENETGFAEQIAQLKEHMKVPLPSLTAIDSLFPEITERIAGKVHSLTKIDRASVTELNRTIEREILGEITEVYQGAQQKEYETIFHNHTDKIPRFPLTDIASHIQLLETPGLSMRMKSRVSQDRILLDKISQLMEVNRQNMMTVVSKLLTEHRGNEVVRISEYLAEEINGLKKKRESEELRRTEIEESQQKRNDQLRSLRDEVSAISL